MISIMQPDKMGSYAPEDVVFLFRDISNVLLELDNEKRERLIQSGTHYSEMLPVEYHPTEAYMALFHETLSVYKERIALAVGIVAEQIVEHHGLENLVLVSLARAGTPIGILIKRYLKMRYSVCVPHYSISILRGRGFDETAIRYIFAKHSQASIQFIDGWTGKGAITTELLQSCEKFNANHKEQLSANLAVLADPGHCASIYGTRADFLIPSACLNSTVSGLVSRTVLNLQFMDETDFHGAKYYKELEDVDVSNLYIDRVAACFEKVQKEVEQQLLERTASPITWQGMKSVQAIQQAFGIDNIHFIKPGVGETTRVLLRRIPWKILINPKYMNELEHILLLAQERNVPIEEYSNMSYACCGLIKERERR
ncbi:cysteine protease StiP family protein [Lysinibacillus sp. fls2-241-R2A-57]|uniref:cysteine protease StiP family protein n=1 Tax=Lysinibacillus sp. fls2-241-R2A-57 TaxID=3040292 RepID=UPI002552CF41|nr:cysteine protease StiP family protein [Lysinibacillus sp. fls2-241-R2A-57]